ncbi:MAG TPA: hypothetical protein GX718_02605 [Brevibacterium sp.]|nr:hypothetical protein [Brevibacterium sp.]
MSGELGSTAVGAEVDEAWREFEEALMTRLATLKNGVVAVFAVDVPEPEGGALPYVQIMCFDSDQLRCEVSSNYYLAPDYQLDSGRVAFIEELGFEIDVDEEHQPAGNHFLMTSQAEAPEVAKAVVAVFRNAFNVAQPTKLIETAGVASGFPAQRILEVSFRSRLDDPDAAQRLRKIHAGLAESEGLLSLTGPTALRERGRQPEVTLHYIELSDLPVDQIREDILEQYPVVAKLDDIDIAVHELSGDEADDFMTARILDEVKTKLKVLEDLFHEVGRHIDDLTGAYGLSLSQIATRIDQRVEHLEQFVAVPEDNGA